MPQRLVAPAYKLFTKDVAERFGISTQAVQRLVRKKALRALKFDGKLHFCERDLLVFEKRNATSRAVEP